MTKITGNKDTVFGFTGHLWHAQSGLNLALYRAYDPNLGVWISRDPKKDPHKTAMVLLALLGSLEDLRAPSIVNGNSANASESLIINATNRTGYGIVSNKSDEVNLYGYIDGNPINYVDPLGLDALPFPFKSCDVCMVYYDPPLIKHRVKMGPPGVPGERQQFMLVVYAYDQCQNIVYYELFRELPGLNKGGGK